MKILYVATVMWNSDGRNPDVYASAPPSRASILPRLERLDQFFFGKRKIF